MKIIILLSFIFLGFGQSSIFSQQIKQQENGSIWYYFHTNNLKDSIKIDDATLNLGPCIIKDDIIATTLISRFTIVWTYYRVNESEQSSILLYSEGIGRGDTELRNNINIKFKDINTIEISNDQSNIILVEIQYSPQMEEYTIDRKYEHSKKTQPIKVLNLALNKNGQVVRRN